MQRIQQRIFVSILGVVFFVACLETVLRVSYSVYAWARRDKSSHRNQPSDFTIVCLGNSYTYGSGAPKGMSYPDFLQRLCSTGLPRKNVRVINNGIVALNTSELLFRLESLTSHPRPDLVIVQIGEANIFNRYRYRDYIRRKQKLPGTIFLSIQDTLYMSKSYKFIVFMMHTLGSRHFFNKSFQGKDEPKDIEQIDNWLNSLPPSSFIGAGASPISQDYRRTLKGYVLRLQEGVSVNPSSHRYYYILGRLYVLLQEYAHAVDSFIKGIRVAPLYRDVEKENKNYFALRRLFQNVPDARVKKTIEIFMAQYMKAHPREADNFLVLSREDVLRWIKDDIFEIVSRLRDQKISVVLMGYPLLPSTQEKKRQEFMSSINVLMRDSAAQVNVPFVDNEAYFKSLIDSGDTIERFFVQDGHCNAGGYECIARNAFEVVRQEILEKP